MEVQPHIPALFQVLYYVSCVQTVSWSLGSPHKVGSEISTGESATDYVLPETKDDPIDN